MKPAPTLALITPGAVSRTPLAGIKQLDRMVTHVVAPTLRQASRVANGLRFARACESVEEVRDADLLLVCDEERLAAMEQFASARAGRAIALAMDAPEVCARRLRARGASVAVITVVDELTPPRVYVEGDEAAVRALRKRFAAAGAQVTVLIEGSRPHLMAARLLLGPVLMGLAEAASSHLRHADMPLDAVRDLAGRLAVETLRAHQRSGARTWQAKSEDALEHLAAAIGDADPHLARHLRAAEAASRALMHTRRGRERKTRGKAQAAGSSI